VDIGFRISNPTKKDLVFNLFDTLDLSMQDADGKGLTTLGGRKATSPAPPVHVPAGKSKVVSWGAELEWVAEGKVLRLRGSDGSGGIWYVDDLKAGKYRVDLHYANEEKDDGSWLGEVQTETVEVEIVPPKPEK
jgi:hypothetical protein